MRILLTIIATAGVCLTILLGFIFYQSRNPANFYVGDLVNTVKHTSPETKTSSETKPTDETLRWKAYGNASMGFQVKYPPDKSFAVTQMAKDEIFLMVPQSDYGIAVSKIGNTRRLSPVEFASEGIVNSGAKVNDEVVTPEDYTFRPIAVAGENGIEVTGPTPGYILVPHEGSIWRIGGSELDKNLFTQILSTFKFFPPVSPSDRPGWDQFQFPETKISFMFPNNLKIQYFPTDYSGTMGDGRRSSLENLDILDGGEIILGISADQPGMGFSGEEKFTTEKLVVNGQPVLINGREVIKTISLNPTVDGYFTVTNYGTKKSMLLTCQKNPPLCDQIIATIKTP